MYNKRDISSEEKYQKAHLMKCISNMGYFGGVTFVEEVKKKCLQRLIEVRLLIGTCSREEKKTIFIKLWNLRDKV